MPTTDLATDLHKQAEAATHGYATKSWLSRVVGDDRVENIASTPRHRRFEVCSMASSTRLTG